MRIAVDLRRRGLVVNHKRVLRIRREDNLLAIRYRKYTLTTSSQHDRQVYLNLAARMTRTGVNQLWVAHITISACEWTRKAHLGFYQCSSVAFGSILGTMVFDIGKAQGKLRRSQMELLPKLAPAWALFRHEALSETAPYSHCEHSLVSSCLS